MYIYIKEVEIYEMEFRLHNITAGKDSIYYFQEWMRDLLSTRSDHFKTCDTGITFLHRNKEIYYTQ